MMDFSDMCRQPTLGLLHGITSMNFSSGKQRNYLQYNPPQSCHTNHRSRLDMGLVMLREVFHPNAYLLIEPRICYVHQYQKEIFRVWPDHFFGFPNRTYQFFGGAAAKI
jgi:hypothetical protein